MGVFDSIKKLVAGDVAHDAADSGNPVKIGGKAASSTPSAVASNDRVNAYWDQNGRLAVHDGGISLTVDGPLTDTQLRATAVPVSGPLTDTQLRAGAVDVAIVASVKHLFRVEAITTYEPPTGVALPASPVAGRVSLTIFNKGSDILYISHTSGSFSVSDAYPIPANGSLTLPCGTQVVYAKPAGTMDVRIIEEYES